MLTSFNIKKIVYGTFAVFVVIYFLSAFLSPVNTTALVKYSITEFQLRLLSASILLPLAGIWACAAYGFVHFKQYALSIKGSAYGKGTNSIANGLGIIALQLLVSGVFSVISSISTVRDALGGEGGVRIISTDLTLIFSLAAALVLYQGAVQLNASLAKPSKPRAPKKSAYVLIAVSVAYLAAIVQRYPTDGSTESVYEYVPLGAAIVGIGVPYIIIWTFYLLAARNLRHYRKHVKGPIYKEALGYLTTGVYIVLGSSVFVQLLGAFSEAFSDLKLWPLLVIVYLLVFAIGIGYLFIARAAAKLSKVEF